MLSKYMAQTFCWASSDSNNSSCEASCVQEKCAAFERLIMAGRAMNLMSPFIIVADCATDYLVEAKE